MRRVFLVYHDDPEIEERGWLEEIISPNGDYVYWEDADQEVARLREALVKAREWFIGNTTASDTLDIINAALAEEKTP